MRSGSCPRQTSPQTGPSRSKSRAICSLFPLVVALILLLPIAFAVPPDPSWIAGIYDGADDDDDDIVILVYETTAANAAAMSQVSPLTCLYKVRLEGVVHGLHSREFTRGPRSPPIPGFPVSAQVSISCPTTRILPHARKFQLRAGRSLRSIYSDWPILGDLQVLAWVRQEPSSPAAISRSNPKEIATSEEDNFRATVSHLGRDPPGTSARLISSTLLFNNQLTKEETP